jgi:peptide/nickel transport system permease protein
MAEQTAAIEAETITYRVEKVGAGEVVARTLAPWKRRPLGILGAVIVVLAFGLAILAPYLAPSDPQMFVGGRLESPNSSHLFGTNNLGQDVLSRTIYGAQVSMAVAFCATFIGVFMGTFLGIVSGYWGGWLDIVVQRGMEVLASFPGIMLALIVVAALGRPKESGSNIVMLSWQLRPLAIAISLAFIFGVMRVIRSQVLQQRDLPYIEAARALGASTPRIMFRHILPNVFPLVIVTFSTIIGAVILIEAGISFLGYGVSIGTPSWGLDLSNRNREFFLVAPWVMAAPSIALILTVLGFNFLGDTFRDILDPRLRGSR